MKKSQWPATSEDGMSYTGADGLARLVDVVDYLGLVPRTGHVALAVESSYCT